MSLIKAPNSNAASHRGRTNHAPSSCSAQQHTNLCKCALIAGVYPEGVCEGCVENMYLVDDFQAMNSAHDMLGDIPTFFGLHALGNHKRSIRLHEAHADDMLHQVQGEFIRGT